MIGSRYQSIESYTKFRDKDSVQREVLWIECLRASIRLQAIFARLYQLSCRYDLQHRDWKD